MNNRNRMTSPRARDTETPQGAWAWPGEYARMERVQVELTVRMAQATARATEELLEIWGMSPQGSAALKYDAEASTDLPSSK